MEIGILLFFNQMVKQKRRHSQIHTLLNASNDWLSNPDEIMNLFDIYFKKVLIIDQNPENMTDLNDLCDYRPKSDMFDRLIDIPTSMAEINAALFSMGPNKASGPDGFHPIIFPKNLGYPA